MKTLIKTILVIATLTIASNALGAEVMVGKDGVACTVLEDARLHCWNTKNEVEVARAKEQIHMIAAESAEKRQETLEQKPASRSLIRLAEL